jgi:hypothetical protein
MYRIVVHNIGNLASFSPFPIPVSDKHVDKQHPHILPVRKLWYSPLVALWRKRIVRSGNYGAEGGRAVAFTCSWRSWYRRPSTLPGRRAKFSAAALIDRASVCARAASTRDSSAFRSATLRNRCAYCFASICARPFRQTSTTLNCFYYLVECAVTYLQNSGTN